MNPVYILSSLGGIVALLTGVVMVFKAIMRNVVATRDNTKALMECHEIMKGFGNTLDDHTVQLAVLNDRIKR